MRSINLTSLFKEDLTIYSSLVWHLLADTLLLSRKNVQVWVSESSFRQAQQGGGLYTDGPTRTGDTTALRGTQEDPNTWNTICGTAADE